jgi:uncharacterized repeat protein (TIGR03803 family)
MSTLHSIFAVLAFALTMANGASAASNVKVLHSFPNNDGKDGDLPTGALVFDVVGDLYGTAEGGGAYSKSCNGGCGVVFKLTPNAHGVWEETVLHSFDADVDGAFPGPGLTFDGQGNFYGTTSSGSGNNDGGTLFELTPDSKAPNGWNTTVVHRFCQLNHKCKDGSNPQFAGVVIDGAGRLYGTLRDGGAYQGGVAYRLNHTTSGWKEAIPYSFCAIQSCGDGYRVADATPILDKAGNLYGTAEEGGLACSCGLVFELKHTSTGWQETILHAFNGNDGLFPSGGLIFDGAGNLYGTTRSGGKNSCDCGTIYKLTPDSRGGWTHSILYSFTDANNNGAVPFTTLVMDQTGSFYGTAQGGIGPCNGGCGVVFKLSPGSNGKWTYTVLHRFTDATNDGAEPFSGVVFDKTGKHLYGTTAFGGTDNVGVVYEITP